jgi:aquaporin Z
VNWNTSVLTAFGFSYRCCMKSILTASLLTLATTTQVLAWGSEGHRIVAEIAEQYLEPATAQQVHHLLAIDNATTLAMSRIGPTRSERSAGIRPLGISLTSRSMRQVMTRRVIARGMPAWSRRSISSSLRCGIAPVTRLAGNSVLSSPIAQESKRHRRRREESGVLYVIASGKAGFSVADGYAEHSPGGYSLVSCLVTEIVLTAMFLVVIMGATDKRAAAGFAPIAIGLALTIIHLVGIPVTNTSVNPARSTGPALFVGGWALAQLWLFWLAPLIGGALGGYIYRWLGGANQT